MRRDKIFEFCVALFSRQCTPDTYVHRINNESRHYFHANKYKFQTMPATCTLIYDNPEIQERLRQEK